MLSLLLVNFPGIHMLAWWIEKGGLALLTGEHKMWLLLHPILDIYSHTWPK